MKRIILKMGVLGVFCLVAGCSDDGSSSPLQPVADNDTEVSSSDEAVDNNSSSSTKPSSASSTKSSDSTGESDPDTTVIHEQVIITDSGTVTRTYISSGVFCWTAGCEEKYSSSSAAPKSSETKIVFTESSSSAAPPPTIEGDKLKDNRDGKSYKIQSIAGKMWMAENLNYETSNSFCSTEGGEDHCAKYGRYYVYASAQRACPEGWRIPTVAEVNAADAEVPHEWWSVGGRFKLADGKVTEFGLENEQGYIWIQAEGENNSFRVKNYNDSDDHELQHSDGAERAYNVRCVQN